MPELPEAETILRQLTPLIIGRRIASVHLSTGRVLRHPSTAAALRRALTGRRICQVTRRGKALILLLDGTHSLIIRLGMSGMLGLHPPQAPFDKHVHLRLNLEEERNEERGKRKELSPHNSELTTQLRFRDPRMFGSVTLRKGVEVDTFPEFALYGPEPLSEEFSAAYLAARLKGRKARLGVILMDQRLVAGIGKIYSDEICFQSGIRPARATGRLTKGEIERVVAATRQVLQNAIGDGGTTASDGAYVDAYGLAGGFRPAVYQRTGQPCLRCGHPVRRTRLTDGRGLHWCAHCQK